MAQSIPEIYPKLREALEQFLHDQAEYDSKRAELKSRFCALDDFYYRAVNFPGKFLQGTKVDLSEEDIVSMEDLAVACAKPLFWGTFSQHHSVYEDSYSKQVAEDLLCLLKPVEEELLLPKEPTDRIWDTFAAAERQHRQFSIVAVYAGHDRSLPKTNELVQSMQAKFTGLLSSFQHVQLQMERQGRLSSELQTKMTGFAKRLKSYYRGLATSMMTQAREEIQNQLQRMTERWLRLSAEAAQIAAAVKELALTEVNSLGSWSLVSGGERQVEEVGSMASGHSVDSQTSYLSGRGGPHCFLPSHVFSTVQSGDEFPAASAMSAKDLRRGTKILAADGATIEVTKVEKQKTNKLLELEIDCAMPLTTTPHHRIIVPSDGEATTVMAVDLSPGNLVICSDCLPKKVLRKTEFLVEEQEVISVTFHPDKAVACFLPPDDPVVLTKGRTPKATRRGGMGSRGSRHEMMSIPDTAAGEYED